MPFGPGTPAATYIVNGSGSITASAPTGGLDTVTVTVTTPGGTSATGAADRYTYVVPPPPTVTGVSPGSGTNGSAVTITGTNLLGATSVDFGSTPSATVTVDSPTTLYAVAPPGTGAVTVTVTTPGGPSPTNPADTYTYTVPPPPAVAGVSPTSGPTGTSVVVTGTNFTGATAVHFGTVTASAVPVNSPTSTTAMAPTATPGLVDVTVTTAGGTSPVATADGFTYTTGPAPPSAVATYRGGLARSGYYPSATGLTLANVGTLKLHWTDAGGTGSFAQPLVANNLVYWGTWNGLERATTLTGKDVWSANVGVNSDSACLPAVAGESGTPTVAPAGGTAGLHVPGGNATF